MAIAARRLPRGLGFWHPVCLISTWFGCGLLPAIPGTWGSLAALPMAWLVLVKYGTLALLGVAVVLFLLGLWSANIYVRRNREEDPQSIVIDEVAAQCLVLTAAPAEWGYLFAGFVLFRIADIVKPWPASWADRAGWGGLSVMLDDVLAGAYAWAALYAVVWVLG